MSSSRGQVKALMVKRMRRAIHDLKMGLAPRQVRQLLAAGLLLSLACTICLVFWLNLGILEHPYTHRLAVVIPFRDRFEELLEFVPHMSRFLTAQGVAHKFFLINQGDRLRFNRGALINIGYLASRAQCDYMVMHDIDLLPLNSKLSYRYPDKGTLTNIYRAESLLDLEQRIISKDEVCDGSGVLIQAFKCAPVKSSGTPYTDDLDNVIVHLAAPHLHPKYHYSTFVGGILLMRHEVFAQLNGLSNKYWGWGLEDDEFYIRAKEAKIQLERPPHNIGSGVNDTFRHIHDARRRPRDMVRIGAQREESRKRDRITGLHNVVFQLQGVYRMQIAGVPVEVHNVQLHCDLNATPWCEKPRPKKALPSTTTR